MGIRYYIPLRKSAQLPMKELQEYTFRMRDLHVYLQGRRLNEDGVNTGMKKGEVETELKMDEGKIVMKTGHVKTCVRMSGIDTEMTTEQFQLERPPETRPE